ncbi:hypothetical protein [Streptomyces sp. NPDC049813]|uniref:hypothetical protein n=1 Tax=Streptomyces sp. NPDC049813 TaxID=3365597 RepID=UPI0037A1C84F
MAWDEWEELKAAAAQRRAGGTGTPVHTRLNQLAPAGGGGGAPDIAIRTKGVHGAAEDTETLSRHAMTRLSHSLDASDAVAAAHQGNGWLSPARLKTCAAKWEGQLVSLARQMGELSAQLKDSAHGYDKADAEAEARLRAAVQDLGQV